MSHSSERKRPLDAVIEVAIVLVLFVAVYRVGTSFVASAIAPVFGGDLIRSFKAINIAGNAITVIWRRGSSPSGRRSSSRSTSTGRPGAYDEGEDGTVSLPCAFDYAARGSRVSASELD
jgi:hypothetical protein